MIIKLWSHLLDRSMTGGQTGRNDCVPGGDVQNALKFGEDSRFIRSIAGVAIAVANW